MAPHEHEALRVVGQDRIDPHPGGVIQAFSRIGYKSQEAIADLVDNSIDAGAKHVLIRFLCTDAVVRRIAIVDDGGGMDEASLRVAMQFGAEIRHGRKDLGKYGIGMKSASFSQCRSLSVLTRRERRTFARRWTIDSIREGWSCSKLHTDDADRTLDSDWGIPLSRHGTIIIWDDLDRLDMSGTGIEQVVTKLFARLKLHLGMVFHRFLAGGGLAISMDAVKYGSEMKGFRQPVAAIDPFEYPASGNHHYPKTFKVVLAKNQELRLDAHIWPPRSNAVEYKLGGSTAARQGFFFYRNDRLIQGGGWNKLRAHESEPHLSLARLCVDLPPELDSLFHLDVQKSRLDVPPGFDAAVHKAKTGGVTFSEYLKDAQGAYRRSEAKRPENIPIVIGAGVPTAVRSRARDILADGERRQRRVKIKWAALPADMFFDIDRPAHIIRINKTYRKAIGGGNSAAGADGAVVKTVLFLLLRNEFDRERVRRDAQKWLDGCNALVIAALHEPG